MKDVLLRRNDGTLGSQEYPPYGALTASREALEGKIDALATVLTILRDNYRRLAEKVYTTEKQVKELLPQRYSALTLPTEAPGTEKEHAEPADEDRPCGSPGSQTLRKRNRTAGKAEKKNDTSRQKGTTA
ncbi:hypothetical protein NDU88_003053 [Pleurodeles waltl]|uniref:Uncharacterized protein n=1 Tax=Pleurodeles waltl TaxID=8319 RepID=A0AAV7QDQ9_PLEWA|nr:hypothetical protein NDU88_003053 [Pleurodeles waltl]